MKIKLYINVLTFTAAFIFGAHSLDYSALQATNVTCPDRDSCKTRTTQKFYARNCECDSLCHLYDDCCIDAPMVSPKPKRSSTSFICKKTGVFRLEEVYATKKCKRNWKGPKHVKRKCENLSDLGDLFMAMPVTNVKQNITFRNRYCSLCNDAVDSELKSWQIGIRCPTLWDSEITLDALSYKSRENIWGIDHENVFHKCFLKFVLPPYLYNNVRQCVPDVTSTCPRTWNGEEVKTMCESYMSITHFYSLAYRNPHCALCNGISINEMMCDGGIVPYSSDYPLSFAMILDVNPSGGDTVGVSKTPCPSGEKYDRIFKRCRAPASCVIPGTEMVNGACAIKT